MRLCAFDVPSNFFFSSFIFIYLTVYFKCQSWGAAVWEQTLSRCHPEPCTRTDAAGCFSLPPA